MSTEDGKSPEIFNSAATLSTSLSMLSLTPGYCTLMARSLPSRVSARCTCPIEAAAAGVKANRSKLASQSLPHSRSNTDTNWLMGIETALLRRRDIISESAGGIRSPASIDKSWPTFIAAPRSFDSSFVTRRALAGVSNMPDIVGKFPLARCLAPSASIPPATVEAISPKRDNLFQRPAGTATPSSSSRLMASISKMSTLQFPVVLALRIAHHANEAGAINKSAHLIPCKLARRIKSLANRLR